MQAVLRLPARLGGRIQISPLVLSISLAPMTLIVAFVTVMFWVSFQKGIFGTASAIYTWANYRELLTDPFVLQVSRTPSSLPCRALWLRLLSACRLRG